MTLAALWLALLAGIFTEQAPANNTPSLPDSLYPRCCTRAVCELVTNDQPFCVGPPVPVASTWNFSITLSEECMGPSSYLYVQMWLPGTLEEELAESGGGPLMALAQGLPPEVLWTSAAELPEFFPPLATEAVQPQSGGDLIAPFASTSTAAKILTPGSFSDIPAWLLSRRHHRIVVPISMITEPFADLGLTTALKTQWHLTVANMASWLQGDATQNSLSIAQGVTYVLRVDCLPSVEQVRCPVATANANDCAGRNAGPELCSTAAGELGPVRVCECEDDWAGYACTVRARTVNLQRGAANSTTQQQQQLEGNSGWIEVVDLNNGAPLQRGGWAHLRVKMQDEQALVVVEMDQRAGNCMLIVKPRGQGSAPYDVPSILDFNDFGDLEAFRDHAPRAARSLLRVGQEPDQELYVAVHNYPDSPLPSEPCEASIRIRSVSPESFETPCPFECTNGQGNCLEDWSMLLTVDPETLPKPPTEPSWRNIDDQLRCTCETTTGLTAEHTGRFCEAPLSNVDTQNDSPLQPGEWRAHRFNVDDLNPTDLNVELTLGEKLDGAWTEHGNVVFVANLFANGDTEKRAPSPTQHDFIFQAGPGVGQPRPYTISKDDLAEVQFIVFAIYNIDAVGEVRYMLAVRPAGSEGRLRPSLIVAIVIGGVVVLLVVIVLCIVIFRQCRARMQDPQVVLQQIGPRVVPPLAQAEIDALETFSFEDLLKKTTKMSGRVLNPPAPGSTPLDTGAATAAAAAATAKSNGSSSPHPHPAQGGVAVNGTTPQSTAPGNPPNPLMCRICQEDYAPGDQLVRLPCGHVFHKSCSQKWLGEETATCPVCRFNLLDPGGQGGALPGRAAGSYTETSFSVPGNLTTPVYTDSAASVVSSELIDPDAAKRTFTQGGMPSERTLRAAAAAALHGSSGVQQSSWNTNLPNGDSPASPNRSRSPLHRMFSGQACATEPSGDGLSQEELFHSMNADAVPAHMSAMLHSVESTGAGLASLAASPPNGGGEVQLHTMNPTSSAARTPSPNCERDGATLAAAQYAGVPTVNCVATGGHTVLGDADVSVPMSQPPSTQALLGQRGGSPMVVPAPAPMSTAATNHAHAPGAVIPAPAPVGAAQAAAAAPPKAQQLPLPLPLPMPQVPAPTTTSSGSPTGAMGLPKSSRALSASQSGASRAVSGVSGDFAGLPPLATTAFTGASGDLLGGPTRPPDWAPLGSDRTRSTHVHEHLLGPVHTHSHHHIGIVEGGLAHPPAAPDILGSVTQWRTGGGMQRIPQAAAPATDSSSAPSPPGTAPGMHDQNAYTHHPTNSISAADVLPPPRIHSVNARLSDGTSAGSTPGSASAAAKPPPPPAPVVTIVVGRSSSQSSEDSLLNSDGGGDAAGDSG